MDQIDESLKELFDKATNYVRTIAGNLKSEQLLYLYSRFKQANEGPCNVPRPGFFDFQGKQKWDAWNNLGQKSKEDAMREYVAELCNIDGDWEEKAGVSKAKAGLGIGVSTLYTEDEVIDDCDKTLFDWLKEDNTEKVVWLLREKGVDVNRKDAEGMAPLHWASDRGLEEMVETLLQNDADVNLRDDDGQTALHVAAFCGHTAVVKLLLSRGADPRLLDNDGCTAADASEDAAVRQLLEPS